MNTTIFSRLYGIGLTLGLCTGLALASAAYAHANTMQIYVTVDWEGVSLEPENIEEMQAFRQQFPNIPMVQLLNPVYFVRDLQHATQTAAIIRSTFLPADTHGLHLHGWKSLITYCEVPYQSKHAYASTDEHCETGDCGYTVSLEYAYAEAELTKVIACSRDILINQGFQRATHFRAGGWQLGPKLQAALQANGFVWDSSRTDASLISSRWGEGSGIVNMVRALHPTSTALEQPFALSETLMEYPNNASLADYTTTKEIIAMFKQLLGQNKRVMVLGFHQETARDFLHRLETAIPQMEAIAKEQGVKIEWVSR